MRFIIVLILLLSSYSSFSQFYEESESPKKTKSFDNERRKGYIGINLGLSSPIGKFTTDDFDDPESGYAQGGFNIDLLNIGYRVGDRIMIVGKWTGTAYTFNESEFENDIFRSTNIRYNTTVDEPWAFGGLFLGVGYNMPLEKADIDFMVMLGSSALTSPQLTHISEDGSIRITQRSHTDRNVAYCFGIQGRYNVSRKFYLNANLSFTTASFEFETDVFRNGTFAGISSWNQPYSAMNLNFGLGYRLK